MENTKVRSRKKKKKKKILVPTCVLLIMVGITYISILFYIDKNTKPLQNTNNYKICEISSRNLDDICEQLENNGIIRNKTAFKIRSILSGVHGKFSKGNYELSPSMTSDELIAVLQTGGIKEENTVTVTIKEGLTIEEIADELFDKKAIYDKQIFLDLCKDGGKYFSSNIINEVEKPGEDVKYSLEGYLFPDTYEFFENSSAESVINRMVSRFNEVYSEAYVAKAKEYGYSKSDVIILASIIEKESKTNDFSKVSSVLHNRLNTGMMLQVDASIRYIENLNNTISITSNQYKLENPYNTYKNAGLPPGPICNPSKNAIEAVLWPDTEYINENYLYFCLTDYETGTMVFSKTYDEHLNNVKKYKDNWREYDEAIE